MSRPVRKRVKKELFVFRDDRRYRIHFRTFFTVFLIFLGGLGTAFSYAYISDTRMQISRVRNELQSQKEANAILRAEITQKYTLDEVAQIATERLGMGKPDASQIIHIYVPKQSYVVLSEEEYEPEPVGIWPRIVSFFSELIEL